MTGTSASRHILLSTLGALRGELVFTDYSHGLVTAWLTLTDRSDLVAASRAIKALGGRLSVITAWVRTAAKVNPLAYLFDVDGSNVTLRLTVGPGQSVATIVPLFRNADWLEREVMELYDIEVSGRPTSNRLFLDASVDAHVMERLIPLSVLANAASTTVLFDRLTATQKDQPA
jgi:NADH-quinone oxidoreductase subunit C